MNKIKLLLIICFSIFTILHSDEVTSSCKDYKYIECFSDGWKFANDNHRDALKNYAKARELNNKSSLVKSYEYIVKAREIIEKEQDLNSKMKKNIYSGSALRPRVKLYETEIKNTYNIKSIELNTTSKNTAQPVLIVECSKNGNNIYVHNIGKSFKDEKKINNMDLADVTVKINEESYAMNEIKSGEMKKMKLNIKKCDNLKTSLDGRNSLFGDKSISKMQLLKKGSI